MTTKHDELQVIGRNALDSIKEMVDALECDYERLAELQEERQDIVDGQEDEEEQELLKTWDAENGEELQELTDAAGKCADADEARQRIEEDPLSIEYRSGWETDKDSLTAAEVCILLTTGGPAVRIIAELDDGTISRPRLEVQDWGTPWTDYYEEGIGEVLQAYCEVFCFE